MRANRLPSPAHAPQIVFLHPAGAGVSMERERLGLRTCLVAWGGLAVASWGVVFALGVHFF